MKYRFQGSLVEKILTGNAPVSPRSLAVFLMIVGAIGFMASLVAWGEQILCLLGSSLVVFGGLGIIAMARKYQSEVDPDLDAQTPPYLRSAHRSADRAAQRPAAILVQTPAPPAWSSAPSGEVTQNPQDRLRPQDEIGGEDELHLLDRASLVFRQQGASVTLETWHKGRGFLKVVSQTGRVYCVLVNENPDDVQTGDLRALFAVLNNQRADQAIYIAAGSFSQPSVAWAEQKSIALFTDDRVESVQLA